MNSKQISFFIESPELASKQKIEAPFNNDEIYLLESYLQQISDLIKTKLIQTGLRPSLNLKWKKEWGGFKVETTLPPEDDFLALLHRLRPFILKKEHASFERVTGLLRKKFKHEAFKSFLKWYRLMYQGKHLESMMTITSGENIVNSEQTMMDWLNSHEYHRDEDKKEKPTPIFETFSHDGAKAIFVLIIVDKINAINAIADLIRLALGKDEVNSIYFDPNPKKDAT